MGISSAVTSFERACVCVYVGVCTKILEMKRKLTPLLVSSETSSISLDSFSNDNNDSHNGVAMYVSNVGDSVGENEDEQAVIRAIRERRKEAWARKAVSCHAIFTDYCRPLTLVRRIYCPSRATTGVTTCVPIDTAAPQSLKTRQGHETICAICLENCNDDTRHPVTLIDCGHFFCGVCLLTWFALKLECPMCKSGTCCQFLQYARSCGSADRHHPQGRDDVEELLLWDPNPEFSSDSESNDAQTNSTNCTNSRSTDSVRTRKRSRGNVDTNNNTSNLNLSNNNSTSNNSLAVRLSASQHIHRFQFQHTSSKRSPARSSELVQLDSTHGGSDDSRKEEDRILDTGTIPAPTGLCEGDDSLDRQKQLRMIEDLIAQTERELQAIS
jgi:hypothetical protein